MKTDLKHTTVDWNAFLGTDLKIGDKVIIARDPQVDLDWPELKANRSTRIIVKGITEREYADGRVGEIITRERSYNEDWYDVKMPCKYHENKSITARFLRHELSDETPPKVYAEEIDL